MISLQKILDIPLEQTSDGTIRIKGTRINLESVIYSFKQGDCPTEILESFPTLSLSNIYGAIYYYLEHVDLIEQYLKDQDEESRELRRVFESRS